MSGKKLPGKPKLPKVLTYCIRLQGQNFDQGHECLMPILPSADSRRAFCEVCNNAITATHSGFKRHNWCSRKDLRTSCISIQKRLRTFCILHDATQSFKLKRPDLESCISKAEAMLRLLLLSIVLQYENI